MTTESSKPRSRLGCMVCRGSRIKCDEVHPTCGRCRERGFFCPWPEVGDRRHRNPRAVTSCDVCREKKVRCSGKTDKNGDKCDSCAASDLECTWSTRRLREAKTLREVHPPQLGVGTESEPPEVDEIEPLLRLYFVTVHQFGYLAFIHEVEFWERYERGLIPEDLVLIMAANALRFGGKEGKIELAEKWAGIVTARLLPAIMTEFGAMDLMALVLSQHYEFLAGRYSRGTIMLGMAVRMMTFLRLHTLDEHPGPHTRPLLGAESLRRLAWAVYYLDATIDGGNFGLSGLVDGALTIQLPSDERPFLLHQSTITEPLHLAPDHPNRISLGLGLGAHTIRAMSARQLVAQLHSRLRRGLADAGEVQIAEQRALRILNTLPETMRYSKSQYMVYKEQHTQLVHLHVMRNTVVRHVAHLHVHVDHQPDTARATLIEGARELSGIFADALECRVVLDPQMAMHAYNALEILLYHHDAGHHLVPLLKVIRKLAEVSELVALLHPEAVNRMIRLGYVGDLVNEDIMAVLKKVHSLSNAENQFDFTESFWRYELSLARSRGDQSATAPQSPSDHAVSPEEALLEVRRERGAERVERIAKREIQESGSLPKLVSPSVHPHPHIHSNPTSNSNPNLNSSTSAPVAQNDPLGLVQGMVANWTTEPAVMAQSGDAYGPLARMMAILDDPLAPRGHGHGHGHGGYANLDPQLTASGGGAVGSGGGYGSVHAGSSHSQQQQQHQQPPPLPQQTHGHGFDPLRDGGGIPFWSFADFAEFH